MKASIREVEFGAVLLSCDDDAGDRVNREFRSVENVYGDRAVMEVFGAVRIQVCQRLYHTGETLWLNKDQSLIALIRKEWRARQKEV